MYFGAIVGGLFARLSYNISLIMQRPIIKIESDKTPISGRDRPHLQLQHLERLLELNREAQLKLRKIKDILEARYISIEEQSTQNDLLANYPICKALNYLNFDRKVPAALKDQLSIKRTTAKQSKFINNVNNKRKQKKTNGQIARIAPNPWNNDFIYLAQGSEEYKCGLDFYKNVWRAEFRKPVKSKALFNVKESTMLVEKQKIYGDNWEKICIFFQGRTFDELYYTFQYHSENSFNRKRKWSLRESIMLVVLVEHYGKGRWAQISKRMKVKSEIQVRERFCNILDPEISINYWTTLQEKKLPELAAEDKFNYNWSKLAQLNIFRGKTDNALWRKFRKLMLEKSQQEIGQIKKRNVAAAILKFKKTHHKCLRPKLEQ